ncbi:MAG: hypothetical protein AAFV53_24460 [Myxococcota bacterium]
MTLTALLTLSTAALALTITGESLLADADARITAGEVETHLESPGSVAVGDISTVWADGQQVTVLAAVGQDGLMGEDFVDDYDPTYQLVLHQLGVDDDAPQRSQLLLEASSVSALPEILWSGDLDGDGAVDLIIDASTEEGVTERVLYLSTRAHDGALVGEAARTRAMD